MKLPYSKIKQYAPKPPHDYQPPSLEERKRRNQARRRRANPFVNDNPRLHREMFPLRRASSVRRLWRSQYGPHMGYQEFSRRIRRAHMDTEARYLNPAWK